MQSDRKQTAAAWRSSAAQDLRIAVALAAGEPNAACFHAQQAGEKALKAASVAAIDDAARTHVLTSLLDALATAGRSADEPVAAAARVLDRYYAPTRYPDAVGDIDPARLFSSVDARDAIVLAQTVIAYADTIVTEAFEPPPARAADDPPIADAS